jgi:hypothetical protein
MKEFGHPDKRDKLNDESIELVEAYLNTEWFNYQLLEGCSKPAANVLNWII